jgi:DMSO/TMAO reductase YedYZ heme-binding membrane subunit
MVAWGLLAASLVWGVMLATRLVTYRRRPAWLLDLHRWLGALALIFTGVHLATLVADNYVTFRLSDLLIPGASEWHPLAVAWGVIGLYLLVAVEVSSLMMKRLPRRVWRWIHLTSYVLFWLVSIHAATAGTDTGNLAYRGFALVIVTAVVFVAVYRTLAGGRPATVPAAASGGRAGELSPRRSRPARSSPR